MSANPITATIPLDEDGEHHGFLRLPYSRDDSAWGSVMIPITVIKNGVGPSALLTGANHGDEYEGPIALMELAMSLKAGDIEGRVIIVPAMNYPAFRAGTRTSPIDRGNMNRSFPGSASGTVTEKIADFFTTVLLPEANVVLDFHSGGKTLDFVPFASAHVLENEDQQAACVAAVEAFNAPYSMMLLEIDNARHVRHNGRGSGQDFRDNRARRRRILNRNIECHRQKGRAQCAQAHRHHEG